MSGFYTLVSKAQLHLNTKFIYSNHTRFGSIVFGLLV